MVGANLQEVHDLLVSIALEAGHIQISARPSTLSSSTKMNTADIVTETDQAIESMVNTRLRTAYPTYEFIGEETYYPGQVLTSAPTFICDPIDGTTNFVHGFPAFCISLGFAVGKVPVVGVIYNPSSRDLYTGIQGKGAFLSRDGGPKQKLPLREHPVPLNTLRTCLVGIDWGSERSGPNYALKTKLFKNLAASKEEGGAMVHSLRSLGSAALNIAHVAQGAMDIYWECGPWAWDVCAGWCILVESGGVMVGGNSGDWEVGVEGRCYLAVRGDGGEGGVSEGQKRIVEEFWGCLEGKMIYEV